MSTSALKLVTGVIDGKSIRNNVSQDAHGFTAGSVVRYDVNHSDGDGGFTAAKASSSMEAEVSGIVEKVVDSGNFILVYQGEMSLADVSTTGNTADEVYFLDSNDAGSLSVDPPNTAGHVIKPVLLRRSDTTGLVMNYLGTVIGGEATVSLDGLVPVGTIYPYAGSSSDVPTGWSHCDGGTLEASRYAELYPRISWNYGVTQKLALASAAFPGIPDGPIDWSNISVGDVVSQDKYRPCGMPGEDCSGGADVLDTVRGTVVYVDQIERYILVDVHVTDVNGNISTSPLFEISYGNVTLFPGPLKDSVGVAPAYIETTSVEYVHKPDLRSRVPIGANHGDTSRTQSLPTLQQEFNRGTIGGEAAHILLDSEVPEHSHIATVPEHHHAISFDGVQVGSGDLNLQITHTAPDGFSFIDHNIGETDANDYESGGTHNDITTHAQRSPNQYSFGTSQSHTHVIEGLPNSTSSVPLVITTTDFGSNAPHNNMQPYLVTEYIIRVSSEARAALVTGIDVNLSLEGLNNVTDTTPANKEIVQYDSGNSTYKKIQPNIDGFGSKDNTDLVIHTSQGTDGSTFEAMRIAKDGQVWIGHGKTTGSTTDHVNEYANDTGVQLALKSTDATDRCFIHLQPNSQTYGLTHGTQFGHIQNTTYLANLGVSASNDYNNIGIYFHNALNSLTRMYKIMPMGMAIGNFNCGESLDVGGAIKASGDIYTYHGGTHGVFAGILGVSAASGGYNLPDVSSGASGAVLMLPAGGGTLEFQVVDTESSVWKGTPALGISFAANVAIGTTASSAWNNNVFGATLQVGGGAIIHAGLTVGGPLQIGLGQAHISSDPISVIGAGHQQVQIKSTDNHTSLVLTGADTYNARIFFNEYDSGGSDSRGLIYYSGSDHSMNLTAWDESLATDAFVTAMKYDMNGKVALGNNTTIDTDFMVSIGTGGSGLFVDAKASLFSGGTKNAPSGHANAPLQVYKDDAVWLQLGCSASHNADAGMYIGESQGINSIWALHPSDSGGTLSFYTGVGDGNGGTLSAGMRSDAIWEFYKGFSGAYQGTMTIGNGLTSGTAVNTHDGSKTLTLSAAYKLSDSAPDGSDKGVAGTVWYEY